LLADRFGPDVRRWSEASRGTVRVPEWCSRSVSSGQGRGRLDIWTRCHGQYREERFDECVLHNVVALLGLALISVADVGQIAT
jgi:hypothetical protein